MLNFLKSTTGFILIIGVFILYLVLCFGFFWFAEYFFVSFIEVEWITNEYVSAALNWFFQGEYSDIIEIIIVGGSALYLTLFARRK